MGWTFGSSTIGGAAAVGKSWFRSTVGLGSTGGVGVGEGVSVGSGMIGIKAVGVVSEGWKGVGVGEAFGAIVTRIKGTPAAGGAGAIEPQPARRMADAREINRLERRFRWRGFIKKKS